MDRSRRLMVVTRTGVAMAVLFAVAALAVVVRYRHDAMGIVLAALVPVLLALPIVGAAAVRAMPRNLVGWILLAAGLALPLAIGAYLYSAAAFDGGADLPGARWAGWLDGWPWVPALAVIPTVGLLLFPDGTLPGRRWRPALWLGYAVIAGLSLSMLFSPHLLDYPDQPNPTGLPGVAGAAADGLFGLIALVAPLSTLSALSLWVRRRRTADPARAQVLGLVTPAAWLVAASWWGCAVITSVGGDDIDALPVEALAMLALAVTAWVAIRRYGLFDTRLVVNRGLVYGALSVCMIGVYLAVVAGVGRLASGTVSGPAAVVIAALVAIPLRDVLQRSANRLLYGYRDDPYTALVRLGQRLADAAASAEVLPAVAQTVRDALRLPYVAVVLGDDTVAVAGGPGYGRREEYELTFAGEAIGTLVAESRDEPFTAAERDLLAGIARQVAAAAHAVSLTTDLLRSRERLVAATEEERRRLRRDLHDGLGPALAGVVLGLQLTRRRLTTDPQAAAEQLDQLTAQTQQAVADVRRLVYGLRPPALDELGLVGALTEQARTLGPITVYGPAGPLALHAAVEVAAYRIALEAMTNVARHARASECTVRVSVDGALHLEIADNGAGLPDGYQAGVGISSMRERATELGGECTIERRTPAGTLVRATLPLELS
jgi:two-component system NarL family sensor kinase